MTVGVLVCSFLGLMLLLGAAYSFARGGAPSPKGPPDQIPAPGLAAMSALFLSLGILCAIRLGRTRVEVVGRRLLYVRGVGSTRSVDLIGAHAKGFGSRMRGTPISPGLYVALMGGMERTLVEGGAMGPRAHQPMVGNSVLALQDAKGHALFIPLSILRIPDIQSLFAQLETLGVLSKNPGPSTGGAALSRQDVLAEQLRVESEEWKQAVAKRGPRPAWTRRRVGRILALLAVVAALVLLLVLLTGSVSAMLAKVGATLLALAVLVLVGLWRRRRLLARGKIGTR